MKNTQIIESFIAEEVVKTGLILQKPASFRTHIQLILDAAAQRGWDMQKTGKSYYSFYHKGRLVGALQQMITSLTSSVAVSICAKKHISREFFQHSSVKVAEGSSFLASEFSEARNYFEAAKKPVVIKPSQGAAGMGISTNVDTIERFELAWQEALRSQKSSGTIVIEKQIDGIDIRVFVVGGEAIAVSTRLPAFVVGDGITTLGALIEQRQAERSLSAYLKRMPMIIDHSWLSDQGLQNGSIIEEGQIVVLNLAFNIHQGGTNLDLTDRVSSSIKKLAIEAASSIPGLDVAGVDLMVQNLQDVNGAVVLEANTAANIALHHYPGYGEPRMVAGSILDLMQIRSEQNR